MSPQNKSSLLTGATEKGQLTRVGETIYPSINDNQILIKAVAYAANPTDWKHPVFGWGGEGAIAGSDVSGIVEEVGSGVDDFKVGDVVSSFIHGNYFKDRGAFSDYVVLDPITTIKYPKGILKSEPLEVGVKPAGLIDNFEGAASVNLGLATIGLSFHHNLSIKADKIKNASQHILLWGGGTTTGILAIQVAKLVYGLRVITTASPKHHDFLRSLGADAVFDYHDSDVVDQIKKVGGANIPYAFDMVSIDTSFQLIYDATSETEEVNLDNLGFLNASSIKTVNSRKVRFEATLVNSVTGEDSNYDGLKFYSNPKLVQDFHEFWYDVFPQYITKIKHPNLIVLKEGLESVNEALEILRDNKVSGEKIVFRASRK